MPYNIVLHLILVTLLMNITSIILKREMERDKTLLILVLLVSIWLSKLNRYLNYLPHFVFVLF